MTFPSEFMLVAAMNPCPCGYFGDLKREYRDISSTRMEEDSAAIRDRVGRARERQRARFRSDKKINCNARMGPRQIRQHCRLGDDSQELIRVAVTELNLVRALATGSSKCRRSPVER